MACNGVLNPPSKSNPPPPKKSVTLPVLKFFTPQFSNFLLPPLTGMAASAFFTHGYFQQAYVHISEAIITD